jgi:hypothetical protein
LHMSLWGRKEVDQEVPACSEQHIGMGESFDELARSIADGTMPRRRALRLFGTALAGTVMASIPAVAWARPSPPPGGGRCPPGQTRCRGMCVDHQSDPNNCGRCQHACSSVETCVGGTCCTSERTCGSRCCGQNEFCADAGQDLCQPVGQCTARWRCPIGPVLTCAPNAQCYCIRSVEGSIHCVENRGCAIECTSSADCAAQFGPGHVCAATESTCNSYPCCQAPCAVATT